MVNANIQVGIFLSLHEKSFCSQDMQAPEHFQEETMIDGTMLSPHDTGHKYPLIFLILLVQNRSLVLFQLPWQESEPLHEIRFSQFPSEILLDLITSHTRNNGQYFSEEIR